ncbi:right-handed parallel beta-helix repeat-containing protein [Lacibacter sp. H407]|uniref:right-handed parallel beta-helix repeat-containing protein n=1 Tax=Lacibacter sp. H407 TaxID=3133423 RepID=UPI0030BD9016
MNVKKIVFLVALVCFSFSLKATNYYINSANGNDSNKGTSSTNSWKTISPVKSIQLKPGDSILFATGQKFTGMLSLINVKGSAQHPVVISSYSFKGSKSKPVLDAGEELNALLIQNSSFIQVSGIEFTGMLPYQKSTTANKAEMRCGILVEVTKDDVFESIKLNDIVVHDVYYNPKGFTRSAAEIKTANGTQNYGWGIRVINNTKAGRLTNLKILKCEVFNVSHTGIKATGFVNSIQQLEIAECKLYQTGGPGMQFSGVTDGHIHHNKIDHSGSTADSRNWGRGSGLWTWSCSNIVIEHNRFENANGPGDSAGVHIDYNCNDVIIQYNVSANNAGGFCEILGNNYNCAYRYNISINDGYRVKGVNGAFQEGKIFWLSGYQGDQKKNAGPYNSYFYNNTIYVAANIIPKIAVSSSADGVLIANNIFYFETAAQTVAGDQKKKEVDVDGVPNVVFTNNLFLRADNWPTDFAFKDATPMYGDPLFKNKGSVQLKDYVPANTKLILNKGISVQHIPNDSIGIRVGLKVQHDILGNPIQGKPDMGAIELSDKKKK